MSNTLCYMNTVFFLILYGTRVISSAYSTKSPELIRIWIPMKLCVLLYDDPDLSSHPLPITFLYQSIVQVRICTFVYNMYDTKLPVVGYMNSNRPQCRSPKQYFTHWWISLISMIIGCQLSLLMMNHGY